MANSPYAPAMATILFDGKTAREKCAALAAYANDCSFATGSAMGTIRLKPGTVWGENKVLVYADPTWVNFTINDGLYEQSTSNFVREEFLDAISWGAGRASGMVTLARIEMQFITGLIAGPEVLVIGNLAVWALYAGSHPDTVKTALSVGSELISGLLVLRRKYPKLFNFLMKTAVKDILDRLPSAAEDELSKPEVIAFFLGRLCRGMSGSAVSFLKDKGVSEVTWKLFIKVLISTSFWITALHIPKMTFAAVKAGEISLSRNLKATMAKEGIIMLDPDPLEIVRELAGKLDSLQDLDSLRATAEEAVKLMDTLEKDFKKLK